MPSEETIRLIISFLGGGLVAGILNWLKSSISERTSRKVELLSDQIRNLYGPLYFFTAQNENFFKVNEKFHDAYKVEFINQQWSQDNLTRERLQGETSQTIEIANMYIGLVKENNEKVIDILRQNYAHIDPDDVDIFQQFVVDYSRLKTETEENGRMITPMRIYPHIGEIYFMRPEFMERVKAKFQSKKADLERYQTGWFYRQLTRRLSRRGAPRG